MEPPTPETTAARNAETDVASTARLPIHSDPAEASTEETDAGTLGEARAHRPVDLHPGFVLVVIT
jgi:fluoride exporter